MNCLYKSIGIYFTEHSNRVYKLISDRGKEYNTYKAIQSYSSSGTTERYIPKIYDS